MRFFAWKSIRLCWWLPIFI